MRNSTGSDGQAYRLVAVPLGGTGPVLVVGRPLTSTTEVLHVFGLVVLTVGAFALWTSALPGSWTYSLGVIRDLGAAYALLLVPLGLVFGGIAEWATRRVQL